jgi:UPF0716 protein FxsA
LQAENLEQGLSMRWVLLFFIAVPLLEMLLLFEVAGYIGGLWTLFLVVLTAVVGVQILKSQGFSTLMRANRRLEGGQLPAQEVVEGLLLAFAGALLLTPGFITDTLGFLCLTAPLRRILARKVIDSGLLMTFSAGSRGGFYWSSKSSSRRRDTTIIEGECHEDPGPVSRQVDNSGPDRLP